ncbi:thiamine pyrophosphate-dependent enzyme [Alphaproteobacteria bacterium]|nr:thiamine pyrophosphate-dependent enzyme [Alphaproteobacteria bacterium]
MPGYKTVNGSLGNGLGAATGMTLGLMRKQRSHNVFAITGDGELNKGANW